MTRGSKFTKSLGECPPMKEIFYDFHLHSCLSPCGDDMSTPANIAGMAFIKGLQAVALTDHNTSRNCPAFLKHCEQYGITALPGMELTTEEEIHVVCLFPRLELAMDFDRFVYDHLLKVPNRPEFFGEQVLRDEQDEIAGYEPNLLINATDISFDRVYDVVTEHGGIMIPAHLDKSSTSLLSNLGFVPPDSKFKCFELHHLENLHRIRRENPYLENCKVICDSDAHYLEKIHEAEYKLLVEENTPEGIIKALSQ